MPPRSPDKDEKGAAEYGREAFSHFAEAARYGVRAVAERKRERSSDGGLREHRSAGEKAGSQIGDLADMGLSKLGKGGKLAAKAGVGRRVAKRLLPDWEEPEGGGEEDGGGEDRGGEDREDRRPDAEGDHLFDDSAPFPIQESIDVAVPVAAVFDLCTRFEELARFSDRVDEVEVEDDTHFALAAKIGRGQRVLAIEIVNEEPEERIDWECDEGFEHNGVVSFHPLAPRLTRLELTIEPASEGVVERALRIAGVPERALRQELRRFKAYAELWDEANDYRSADFKDPASEAEDREDEENEAEEEEPEPEDGEPEAEDREEQVDEDDQDEEEEDEPLEEEELEPAAEGRSG